MERSEVIGNLQHARRWHECPTDEALDIAIASLETDEVYQLEYETTTKNDLGVDCIDRADAIKAMQDKAKKLTNEDIINGLCGAVAILYEMPSVTPQEPKTGHWIDRDVYDADRWKCSECGRTEQYQENFCPNCGADMRGEEV